MPAPPGVPGRPEEPELSRPPTARRPTAEPAEAWPAPGVPGLPAEPEQARRFGKARTARAAALHEDYVELIADLLAAGGKRAPPTSPAASASPTPPPTNASPG